MTAMRENLPTGVTQLWSLPKVNTAVNRQTTQLSKCLAAVVAHVGSLAGVQAAVDRQV